MLQEVTIPTDTTILTGRLLVPGTAAGAIIRVHGTEPVHAREVEDAAARTFAAHGFAVMDVELTFGIDQTRYTDENAIRDAVHVIAQRLMRATDWLRAQRRTAALPIGYFGVGVGGSAACVAAVTRPAEVEGLVTWEGRLDLVGRDLLHSLHTPVLMLLRNDDPDLLAHTRTACAHLGAEHAIELVEPHRERREPEHVASCASAWYERFLSTGAPSLARTSAART